MSSQTPAIVVALASLGMAAVPGQAASRNVDSLAVYQWKSRVLVVFASESEDPKLRQQRALFRAMKAGAVERDLELVEAIGDSRQAVALRARFGLDPGFHAVLVGKDGGDKLASSQPVGAEQLFPVIDAMPMRKGEMTRRR